MATAEVLKLKAKHKASPSDPEIKFEFHKRVRAELPIWHLAMINDDGRNTFYRKMIAKHVKGKTVLEIGTGTGFLSLLAAQSGAKHVYTCEQNPIFQDIAARTVADSRYSSKITLISKPLNRVKIPKDLPQPVDVILSEVIATDVFSEGMIETLTKSQKLLKPGGLFLPGLIEVWACLVSPAHEKRARHEYFIEAD